MSVKCHSQTEKTSKSNSPLEGGSRGVSPKRVANSHKPALDQGPNTIAIRLTAEVAQVADANSITPPGHATGMAAPLEGGIGAIEIVTG